MDNVSDSILSEVASRYGFVLNDRETRSQYRETIQRIADRTDLSGIPSTADPAVDFSLGTDEYNAFRQRFELAPTAPGELDGQTLAVKENIGVSGVPSTCGSAGFSFEPPGHAAVIDRLRAAGGRVIGTTNMDEFAYSTTGDTCAHGPVENPAADGRLPGGSSSGSAAAVAGGLADAALGTDTAGSVRIPAAFCGVVGYKPTRGLISRRGVIDLAPSLDHLGALAPDVETATIVVDAIAGPNRTDPTTTTADRGLNTAGNADSERVSELTIGVPQTLLHRATPPVREQVQAVLDALSEEGASIRECSLATVDARRMVRAAQTIIGVEFATLVDPTRVLPNAAATTDPAVQAAFQTATSESSIGEHIKRQLLYNGVLIEHFEGRRYWAAQQLRRHVTASVREQFEEVDALLTPTTPMPPPTPGEIDGMTDLRRMMLTTAPFNLTGSPALSVPVGHNAGRPIGIQVVADYHEEATLGRVARAVERCR